MTTQRLNEYFADEAAEYLEQLEDILAGTGEPDVDRFLRLATGIRGSMQMAGAQAISSIAGRLEDAARALAEARAAWTDELRYVAQRTVADIRALVDSLERWGPEEERTARSSIARWDTLGDSAPGGDRPVVPIDALFYDDDGPHVIHPSVTGGNGETAPVSIEDLLLRGEDALREALALRPVFESIARGDAVPERSTADLVDELFDLIDLGLSVGPRQE